MGKVSKGLNE